jgi:DNA-binding HxlR family transcriptional regulator
MDDRVVTVEQRHAGIRWLFGQGRSPLQLVANVIANKHRLALIWELADGPKRFNELQRALLPVTPKVLTRSLRELDAMSLIERHCFDERAPRVEYRLAPLGESLRPHIHALCAWASEHVGELTFDGQ